MISSPEEARLLLNKWRSEEVLLVAFLSSFPSPPADFVVRLEGKITVVEESTGTVIFESDENFIMFRLGDVNQYEESVDLSANLLQIKAKQKERWAAALCLSYGRATIVFCLKT